MKIKKLSIFWFWNYKKEVEIDFSELDENKAYCLVTWENWVGKSMLFELIVNCLTWTWRVSNLKDLCNKDIIEQWKDCFVRLHLDDEKWSEYVIEKIIEANKLSLYIEFYRLSSDWNKFEIAHWNKEAKKAIEEFIQIDSNSIYDSIYSSQWELLSFFNRTPDEARRIIMNLLWTEQYLDKSKAALSVSRSLNSRIKELEEERWEKIEKNSVELNEEIENYKKEIDSLKQKEKNKNVLKEIQNEDFSFDEYLDNKKRFDNFDWEVSLDEEKKENEIKEKNKESKELELEINEIQNNEKRKIELSKEKQEIEDKKNEIESKLNDEHKWKTVETLKSFRESNENLLNSKKEKIIKLNSDKDNSSNLLNKKKEEIENIIKELLKEEQKITDSKNKEEKKREREAIQKAKNIINNFETFDDEHIEELNKAKEVFQKEKDELRIEYHTVVTKYNDNVKKLKDWNIIICHCCNSIVSEENIDHYNSKAEEYKFKDSKKEEFIKNLKEETKNLKLKKEEIEILWLETRDLITFIENIEKYHFIKLEHDELNHKISEIEKELHNISIEWKSQKELEDEIKEINESIENIKEIDSLETRIKELNNKLEEVEKLIWDKDISKLEIEKNTLLKEIDSIENELKNYREYKNIKNSYELSKLKYEKLVDKIKNYTWKDIDDNNFLEIYKWILNEDSSTDFTKEIDLFEEKIKINDKLLLEIEKHQKIENKIVFLYREKDYYDKLWEIYDFIAKDLYKKSLPLIKTIVNKKLNLSSKWKYQFHIETEKDWKEVFIPKVHLIWDSLNNARSVNTLSWWEATWVATALREAFTMLASKRSWFQWSFWVFDETFWNQDWEHLDSLIWALMENSFLKQVFLITHDNEAKDKIRMLWWQELVLYKDEDWDTQVKFISY